MGVTWNITCFATLPASVTVVSCDAHQWNEKFQNSKMNISQHVAALKVTWSCSAPGPLHLRGVNLTKTCQTYESHRCAIWRYCLIKSDVQLYPWTTAPSPTPDWIASKLTLPFLHCFSVLVRLFLFSSRQGTQLNSMMKMTPAVPVTCWMFRNHQNQK